jgi:hypothetical protein
MVNIVERNGIFVLEGDYFDLKIDNNRRVYIRKKGEKIYTGLEEVEQGLNAHEKKKYLFELHNMILMKLRQRKEEEKT